MCHHVGSYEETVILREVFISGLNNISGCGLRVQPDSIFKQG